MYKCKMTRKCFAINFWLRVIIGNWHLNRLNYQSALVLFAVKRIDKITFTADVFHWAPILHKENNWLWMRRWVTQYFIFIHKANLYSTLGTNWKSTIARLWTDWPRSESWRFETWTTAHSVWTKLLQISGKQESLINPYSILMLNNILTSRWFNTLHTLFHLNQAQCSMTLVSKLAKYI